MKQPRIHQSEDELLSAVIDLARLRGWLCAHFRPAQVVKNGQVSYRTAVQGDGKGFPDLVMVREGRLIFAECKSEKGKVSPEQDKWLTTLAATNAEVYTFR